MTDTKVTVQDLLSFVAQQKGEPKNAQNQRDNASPTQQFSTILASLRGDPNALTQLRNVRQAITTQPPQIQRQWQPVLDQAISQLTSQAPEPQSRTSPAPYYPPADTEPPGARPVDSPQDHDVDYGKRKDASQDQNVLQRSGSASNKDVDYTAGNKTEHKTSERLDTFPPEKPSQENQPNAKSSSGDAPKVREESTEQRLSPQIAKQQDIPVSDNGKTKQFEATTPAIVGVGESGDADKGQNTIGPGGQTKPPDQLNAKLGVVPEQTEAGNQNPKQIGQADGLKAAISPLATDSAVPPSLHESGPKDVKKEAIPSGLVSNVLAPVTKDKPSASGLQAPVTTAPNSIGGSDTSSKPVSQEQVQGLPKGEIPSGEGPFKDIKLTVPQLLLAREIDNTFGQGTAASSNLQLEVKGNQPQLGKQPLISGSTIKSILSSLAGEPNQNTDQSQTLVGQPKGTTGSASGLGNVIAPLTGERKATTKSDQGNVDATPAQVTQVKPQPSVTPRVAVEQGATTSAELTPVIKRDASVPVNLGQNPTGPGGTQVAAGSGASQANSGGGGQTGGQKGFQGDTGTRQGQSFVNNLQNGEQKSTRQLSTQSNSRSTTTFASLVDQPVTAPRVLTQTPATARTPVTPQQLHQVITRGASEARAGGDQLIKVRLSPGQLGNVQLQFEFNKENKVKVLVLVESREALDQIGRERAQIIQSLKDRGYEADSSSLEFSMQDNHGNQGQAQDGERMQQGPVAPVPERAKAQVDVTATLASTDPPSNEPGINVIV